MKTIAASLIAITALLTFSSCETVVVEPTTPTVRTTTTEETIIQRPNNTTTETRVHSY